MDVFALTSQQPLDTRDQIALAILAARISRGPIETAYFIKEAYRVAEEFLVHRQVVREMSHE